MKKLICILLCAVLIFLLCSCAKVESIPKTDDDLSMFVVIEKTSSWYIVYHRDTKVMYGITYGAYSMGNFVPLINADGTPMIYGG